MPTSNHVGHTGMETGVLDGIELWMLVMMLNMRNFITHYTIISIYSLQLFSQHLPSKNSSL